jgi:ABC-type multidrug transport system fused ATPase/permease subunit
LDEQLVVVSQISSPAQAQLGKDREASNAALVGRMLALAWRYAGSCVGVLVQQFLLVALNLSGLGLVGLDIDVIRHAVQSEASSPRWPLWFAPASWPPLATVAAIGGGVLLLALAQSTLRYRAAVSAARLVQKIVVQLRSDVYDKLQRLSFRFFDANESSSIINRVAGDVRAMSMFVDMVLIEMLGVLLSLALYLCYMLSINVPLTLACLATTPLMWLCAVVFSRLVRPAYRRNRELSDQMILTLSENVQGAQVVKGFGRETQEIRKFEIANGRVKDQKHTIFRKISFFQPGIGFLTQLNLAILLGYGGYLVVAGELRLGVGLFVFANLLQRFADQVGQIANITNSIQASLTGAQRVFEVLDAPLEVANPPRPVRLSKPRGAVAMKDVDFRYRAGEAVLRNIHFEVEPGECVAIAGATGAGKSTLLSLIPRFYDAAAGQVLVDGVDVRLLGLDELRRTIGLVFQESFLFSNTVAANIAFGHPQATRGQVERAAKIAAAHEFIVGLPSGYDTVVGEFGSNLSGGQRQRIAIARAILLEPSILILDDATAAVDPQTEHEILQAMQSAMRGRTTFVVAHRLSTLRRADRVIVLERGRIVQMGTHDDLMRGGGAYHRAAHLQILDAESSRLLNSPSSQVA